MPTAKRKPPTSLPAKKAASRPGTMTKPRGIGGNGPSPGNTGSPYPKPKRGKY